MSFPESIRVCLHKYADFSGRSPTFRVLVFVLWIILVSIVASIIDYLLGTRRASAPASSRPWRWCV